MSNNQSDVHRFLEEPDDVARELKNGAAYITSSPPPHPLIGFFHSLALAPALTLALVWTFSWRVASVIGYWPRPSLDDPGIVAPGDLVTTVLYWSIWLCLLWSFLAPFILPLFTLLLWRSYLRVRLMVLLVIYGVAMEIMRLDPGARLAWFGD
jgi:hypothetical protein